MAGDKDEGARPEGWTREEKERGAPETGNAGAAGKSDPKAKPTDDRAETESAAARIEEAQPVRPGGNG